ncbi:MAG: NAD-dependent epimerase/dehydratase family protein [Pyrinomonadaceae bacterium]
MGTHLVRQLLDGGARNLRVLATSAPAWLRRRASKWCAARSLRRTMGAGCRGRARYLPPAGRVSRDRDDAHEMYDLHVNGTRLLCDAARAVGVQSMVMASTSGTIAVTENGDATPDEAWPTPLDIISRWPYYISKVYQETTALERFGGQGRRLVIVNPSLLLGPGDARLGSTKFILDFLGRKINAVPSGGVSFVDARDAAAALIVAMERAAMGKDICSAPPIGRSRISLPARALNARERAALRCPQN